MLASFAVLNTDIFTLLSYVHVECKVVFHFDLSVYSYTKTVRQKYLRGFKSSCFCSHVGWVSEAKVSGQSVLYLLRSNAAVGRQNRRFVDEA